MRVKMVEARSLAKLFDPFYVDWALGQRAGDNRSPIGRSMATTGQIRDRQRASFMSPLW